jgi:hypothetical protein
MGDGFFGQNSSKVDYRNTIFKHAAKKKAEKRRRRLFSVLNLTSYIWSEWSDAKTPQVDDFAFVFIEKLNKLYIFGGFSNGSKTNTLYEICVRNKEIRILETDGLRSLQTSIDGLVESNDYYMSQ